MGMSGGVDSSAAALLLKQQGYDVVGVMLKLWAEEGFGRENQCCSLESANLARKIAARIGIPFYLLDVSGAFYASVVQPFIQSYLDGETPNPCAFCNPLVRWRRLLGYADAIGAGWVATGHYANLQRAADGTVRLFRGIDQDKDQSYIISRLSQDQLKQSIFPLGEYHKSAVRQLAAEFELPSASKPDSQDICFIGDGSYRNFLLRHAEAAIVPGEIVTTQGETVGEHAGLPFYTIGQRKGLKIAAPAPYYVVRKDQATNRLIVGGKDDFSADLIQLTDCNWPDGTAREGAFAATVQYRYKAVPKTCTAEAWPDGSIHIHLEDRRNDIACGQIAVLYSDAGEVLASGRIASTGILP